jgi:hypothetical protein
MGPGMWRWTGQGADLCEAGQSRSQLAVQGRPIFGHGIAQGGVEGSQHQFICLPFGRAAESGRKAAKAREMRGKAGSVWQRISLSK